MVQELLTKQKLSYEDFYSENYRRVLCYVRGKVSNNEDAEDLTGEVFLYCYSHYDTYDPQKSSIKTWLYLIVNSRLKNYYRDHVTHVDFESVEATMQAQDIALDEAIYMEQLHNALMTAIGSLPERQKKIVMMRYFQNLSSEEIARKMGIKPGNARVLLSRALDKLSSFNDGYWKEFVNHG